MALPITVWITPSGPNPWKAIMIMEELRVAYKLKVIRFEDTKTKPFILINPNGRVPVIEDPNYNVTISESGAIILHLIENYNPARKLTYDAVDKKSLLTQWLMFQMSGQGPYYGQLAWFGHYHPEKFPSAIERYEKEMRRILGVLETALQGKSWLVGDKITYADLSFVWWNELIKFAVNMTDSSPLQDFPSVWAWHRRMTERESFKTCADARNKLMQAAELKPESGLPEGVTVQDLLAKADQENARATANEK